ncbi:MAG TPA: M50 family metallopeptidase [Blastocatellia bacterium]|nr:M50 family metallopeptidase [Blastocatellia bacterium]
MASARAAMTDDKDSLKFLLGATALSIIFSYIPFAGLFTYPFRLFVTFIHEGGHAAATWLTFGHVDRIVINPDTSGVTLTLGGLGLLVASAGYLTTTIYGATLLVICRQGRSSKSVIALTAAAILALTVFVVSGTFGWLVGLGLVAGLIYVAVAASIRVAHFFLSFLAVQCCLNALYDLNTLFVISAMSRTPSDAMNMQRMTMIPAVFWSVAWLGVSIIVLIWALRKHLKG